MKEQDKKILYRPETAAYLREKTEKLIALYSADQRGVMFKAFAIFLRERGDSPDEARLMQEAADAINSTDPYAYGRFCSEHKEGLKAVSEMSGTTCIEDITEASAMRWLKTTYEKLIDSFRDGLDTTGFTKMEMYTLDTFFRVLSAPLRDPNIQIKDGSACCWYDSQTGSNTLYRHAMENTIEYIRKNNGNTLDIWETPDEE